MGVLQRLGRKLSDLGIFALCFGYFASYVPYSMFTKMLTKGLFPGMDGKGCSGFEIQASVSFTSLAVILIFITAKRWWKYTRKVKILGMKIFCPEWYTALSGLCLSGQIVTTTLAYTFDGVSIVFAMLLMRGGVLVMAPVVDLIVKRRHRKIYWPSWVAAGLSLMALFTSFMENSSTAITIVCAVDIGLYLFVYFLRLFFMSGRAKSEDTQEMKKYFAEEQTTANILMIIILFVIGLIGSQMSFETIPHKIWDGFTIFWSSGYIKYTLLIGFFSTLGGIFGSLIFLDKRENTFTVPANRASSIVSGVVATYLLAILYGQKYPYKSELLGVFLILIVIVFLAYRGVVEKRQKNKNASPL